MVASGRNPFDFSRLQNASLESDKVEKFQGGNLMKRFFRLMLAADDGGSGGGPADAADDKKPTVEPKEDPKKDPASGSPDQTELEKTKKELAELKAREAAAEKARKDAERQKMSDDERKAAELKDLQDNLVKQNRIVQLQKAGLDEEYLALVAGSTAEEVEQSGALLAKLVAKVKADTEAEVKKGIAQTGAPGSGGPATTKVDSKTFFKNILGRK